MKQRRAIISFVSTVVVSAVLVGAAGCGFPVQDEARSLPEDELPVGLQPGATPPSTASVDTEPATIWLVDGDALDAVRHDVAAPASIESVTTQLLIGPSEAEQGRGLRSALPDPDVVSDASLSRGIATVDLTSSFAEISPEDQLLAVGQFVLTLTDLRGVGSVQFTVDGVPAAVPTPTGESTEQAVFREQFLELTAQSPTS
jgi:spore germination protein GerM